MNIALTRLAMVLVGSVCLCTFGAESTNAPSLSLTATATNHSTPNPQTLSACQITIVIGTNWTVTGIYIDNNGTNGNAQQFNVEVGHIYTNAVLKARYNGVEREFVLESVQGPRLENKRMVPIIAVPSHQPPPIPVAASSNAVYFKEFKP